MWSYIIRYEAYELIRLPAGAGCSACYVLGGSMRALFLLPQQLHVQQRMSKSSTDHMYSM